MWKHPAIYYNDPSSRNSSTTSTTTTPSTKTDKLMAFLAPRYPIHPPLTPTNAGKANRKVHVSETEPLMPTNAGKASRKVHVSETEYAPARIYDSVLRRPLFSKAKPGNEQTMAQRKQSSSERAERQKKAMASVDRSYTAHMTAEQQDKSWQRAAYGA